MDVYQKRKLPLPSIVQMSGFYAMIELLPMINESTFELAWG
jgi:hypothetical protein